MVNLASIVSAVVVGLAAIASASPTLHKRAVTCREDLGSSSYGRASEAVECINYLAGLGNQACVSSVSGVNFCRRGNVQITGLSRNGNSATSSCANVARAAGAIMDRCTTVAADGGLWIKGANEAWGNGNLLVDIRNINGD